MDWHSAYNVHISPLLKSICDICKEEISCESMHLHWKRVHQSYTGKVKCQICEKGLDPGFMRKHLVNKHDQKKEELSYYKCPLCDFKGMRRSDLKTHVNQEHDGRRYKCQTCPSVFKLISGLQKHISEVHCKMNELKCDECDFKTLRKAGLENHVRA